MESEHETSSTQDRLYQWSSTQDRLYLSFSLLHSHCLSFSLLHSVCFILIACHSHSHCFILIVILIACDSVRSISLLVMIGSLIQSLRHCLSSFLQYEIVCRCTYMRNLELSIGNMSRLALQKQQPIAHCLLGPATNTKLEAQRTEQEVNECIDE